MSLNLTKIEWVKNPDGTQGYTWNPITGCLNHTPEGLCLGGMFPCYAYKLANGRLKSRYLANKNWDTHTPEGYEGYPNLDPFYPRFWEKRLNEPVRGYHKADWFGVTPDAASTKGIFVCDMSDLFGIGIPEEWTERVIDTIKKCPQDRFYLLTKQPRNLVRFSPFPQNCYVGVTATDDSMIYNAMAAFRKIEAKVKYLSIEPFLSWDGHSKYAFSRNTDRHWLDWLIIGAQTKPYKPPRIEWVEEIAHTAVKANVKVFMKYNLSKLYASQYQNYRLRQEMPREGGK